MADKASEAAGRVAGAVEEGAKRAGDKASDIATKAADIYSAVDDSVKSQPMATLAAAAGIGFVLGALWKS
jgi:ElaB/YqjD/DUF883 family membrane-anchored ribosome-binding protein